MNGPVNTDQLAHHIYRNEKAGYVPTVEDAHPLVQAGMVQTVVRRLESLPGGTQLQNGVGPSARPPIVLSLDGS